jgi:hypothetical protein
MTTVQFNNIETLELSTCLLLWLLIMSTHLDIICTFLIFICDSNLLIFIGL